MLKYSKSQRKDVIIRFGYPFEKGGSMILYWHRDQIKLSKNEEHPDSEVRILGYF